MTLSNNFPRFFWHMWVNTHISHAITPHTARSFDGNVYIHTTKEYGTLRLYAWLNIFAPMQIKAVERKILANFSNLYIHTQRVHMYVCSPLIRQACCHGWITFRVRPRIKILWVNIVKDTTKIELSFQAIPNSNLAPSEFIKGFKTYAWGSPGKFYYFANSFERFYNWEK